MPKRRTPVIQRCQKLLFAALELAALGFLIVPLAWITDTGSCSCRRSNSCTAPGKHPLIKGWRQEATTSSQKVNDWWRRWPNAGVGIATGPRSNLLVVDIDPKYGGDESLQKLESAYGELPKNFHVRTGGGGSHIYLRYPDFAVGNSVSSLARGVDIRGDGGLVVAPPSRHVSGRRYEWISCKPKS